MRISNIVAAAAAIHNMMSWSSQVAAAPFSSANTAMIDLLVPLSQSAPNTNLFPKIQHPYPPEYADPRSDNVVPTNSWISNLFYHSVEHLAPTTPDPYTLRIFDGYGGNPGLSIRQPSNKVYDNIHIFIINVDDSLYVGIWIVSTDE